jgi:hypothetical protein
MRISQNRQAVILGNGPSLRGFDFSRELKGFDTFGMNAAYRHWNKIGWYPTYYACTDTAIAQTHKDNIHKLLRNRDAYGIQAFLLNIVLNKTLGKDSALPCVIPYPFWLIRNNFLRIPCLRAGDVTVGGLSLLWAVSLGYRYIILLGIDANFPIPILNNTDIVNTYILERERYFLKINSTPEHNANYFFDDYQQKGDMYGQVYDANNLHKCVMQDISKFIQKSNVQVINANPVSNIDCFFKCTWEEAKYTINKLYNL